MQVEWIEPGATLGAAPGEVVVCIPVFGAHELFVACLESVLVHTEPGTPIVVCDDASPDDRSAAFVRSLADGDGDHRLVYLRQPRNVGFPANANAAFAAAAPADVVILNSDCVVGAGWLDGLRAAAGSDSTVATVTTLTNHGTIVSVPNRRGPGPLPADWTVDRAAAAVRAGSLRLRPRLPTAVGHCLLIRRAALDLVGGFDESFSPGYGEEVDFSQRCLQAGLCHVLADDVFVFHRGSGSFAPSGGRSAVQEVHEGRIRGRYPYYADSVREVEQDVSGPLARALGAARRSLTGLSVLIDARILSGPMTGTQLHVMELIAALSRTGQARLTVLVPDRIAPYAEGILGRLAEVREVTRSELESEEGKAAVERVDVVHRPFQVNNHDDLSLLTRLGDRLVVTNQDLIGYHNPAYFRSFEDWQGYRAATRLALSLADGVVFFSAHARGQALEEDLLEAGRAHVVHIGVDHALPLGGSEPTGLAVAPRGAEEIPEDAEVVLCLGTDFRHKNRLFALRVLEALRRRHGWRGRLVLAGPSVTVGSSRPAEAAFLVARPEVRAGVVSLGAVSEAEKVWLLRRSRLVLYPTVHEGFGLVPFEAADHGVPCAWAPGTSLSEVLPDAEALIRPWDAETTADRIMALLGDADAAAASVRAVRAAAREWTWDRTATGLLDVYRTVCEQPATPGSRMGREEGIILGELSEDAMRLVGPGGAIPPDVERPLLALATHSAAAVPVFGALRLGYRVGYGWRRRRLSGDADGPTPG